MRRPDGRKKITFPLILSLILLLHVVSLILHVSFPDATKILKTEEDKPLVVKLTREITTRKQIVQSADSKKREEKENAFLSDKTRSFDRQTKARVTDVFKESSAQGGTPPPQKKSPQKKLDETAEKKKNLKLSDLGSLVAENPYEEAAKEYTAEKKGLRTKNPSRNISATNDHLEKVAPGDITNLNTIEYKYYGFYHRIRQKLEQFWNRSIYNTAEQMAQEGRRVPASNELITSLEVTLDAKGEIVDIKILETSGIQELDEAAVESFNEAGPFPNPPKDLIVDGKCKIEWGFVVKS